MFSDPLLCNGTSHKPLPADEPFSSIASGPWREHEPFLASDKMQPSYFGLHRTRTACADAHRAHGGEETTHGTREREETTHRASAEAHGTRGDEKMTHRVSAEAHREHVGEETTHGTREREETTHRASAEAHGAHGDEETTHGMHGTGHRAPLTDILQWTEPQPQPAALEDADNGPAPPPPPPPSSLPLSGSSICTSAQAHGTHGDEETTHGAHGGDETTHGMRGTGRRAPLTDILQWTEPQPAALEDADSGPAPPPPPSPPISLSASASITSSKPFACPLEACTRRFTRAHGARRHIQRVHSENSKALLEAFDKSAKGVDVRLKCRHCNATFGSHGAKHNHERSKHATNHAREQRRFPCDYCPQAFTRMRGCLDHMVEKHPLQLEKDRTFECKTFPDQQAFEVWVSNEERVHVANYTRRHRSHPPQPKHTGVPGLAPSRYVVKTEQRLCARARPRPDDVQRQARSRAVGTCRARMFVQHFNTGHVRVELYRRHTHDAELRHVHVSQAVKTRIRQLALDGHRIPNILERVVSEFRHDARAQCLNYDDVYRVARPCDPSVLAPQDQQSVAEWVRRLNDIEHGECTVRAFKKQGDARFCVGDLGPPLILTEAHFVLIYQSRWQREQLQKHGTEVIYMDATHGTNTYGFHLTNIAIAGRHGTLAVAHMISNSLSSWVIERFLRDTVCKHSLAPKYVVTDDDNAEFKAITCVLPTTQHRLCQLHVCRNWQRRLPGKVSTAKLAKQATDALCAMMRELDEHRFEAAWASFKQRYSNEPSLVEYIAKYYYMRKHKWANCFGDPLSTRTTNAVESFHNSFKRKHLDRCANGRVDRLLFALTKNDERQQREARARIALNRPTRATTAAAQARKKAAALQVVRQADGSFEVCNGSKSCVVAPGRNLPCNHCKPGAACVHLYSCVCNAYQISGTPRVCEHTVAAFLKEHGQGAELTTVEAPNPKKPKLQSKGADKAAVLRDAERIVKQLQQAEFVPPSVAESMNKATTVLGMGTNGDDTAGAKDFLAQAKVTDHRSQRQPNFHATRRRRKKASKVQRLARQALANAASRRKGTSTGTQGQTGEARQLPQGQTGEARQLPQGQTGEARQLPQGRVKAGPHSRPCPVSLLQEIFHRGSTS